MENFKEIKKVLLKDDNIGDVEINEQGQIVVIPNQSKSFWITTEPLKNFIDNNGNEVVVEILNERFEVVSVDHFNTTIYEIVLKDYGTCSLNLDAILQEMKENYLGKEMSIENLATDVSGYENQSERFFFDDIFNYNVREKLEESFMFLELKDENYNFDAGINFEFEIIQDVEEDEDEGDIIVKVTSIDLI